MIRDINQENYLITLHIEFYRLLNNILNHLQQDIQSLIQDIDQTNHNRLRPFS